LCPQVGAGILEFPVLITLSDLHGRLDLLEAALAYYPSDTQYVFLGDAIDRGPDSRGVVRKLLELSDANRVVLVRGNHEAMIANAVAFHQYGLETGQEEAFTYAQNEFKNWILNGGSLVLREYGVFELDNVPRELLEFLKRTQYFFEADAVSSEPFILPELPNVDPTSNDGGRERTQMLDRYFREVTANPSGRVLCAHAAPPVLIERYGSVEDSMLWARPNEGPFPLEPSFRASIHGHTPLAQPTWVGQHLYTDLGAVYSGALCTVDIGSEQLDTIVFESQGQVSRRELPELSSSEGGLVRAHPYKIVPV
jgi:serine/threonine protein phosphatase 1